MSRIFVAAHGSRGDIQPLLALAVGLQAAGHHVEMSAPPDFCAWIAEYGLLAHPVGHNMRELVEAHGGEIMKNRISVARRMLSLIHDNLRQQHLALMPLAEGFDLMVASSLQLSAFSAAEYWHIPYRYLVYCPSLVPSQAHMPMIWPWPVLSKELHQLAWFFEVHGWELALGRVITRIRKEFGLPPLRGLFRAFLSDQPLLAAYKELAPAAPDQRLAQTPALHLAGRALALPPDLEDFLQAGEAPVYLGFGSMNDGKAAATTEAVIKMAKRRTTRFVLSKGWAGLGQAGLPENICLIDAVEHDLLFPRLRGVIHHGGAGTTSASARAGMPQMVVPHLLDQNYWAHAVYTRGLGPPGLPKGQLSVDSLDRGIQRLLRPDYQLRAQGLGRILRRQNGVAEAIALLHPLARRPPSVDSWEQAR